MIKGTNNRELEDILVQIIPFLKISLKKKKKNLACVCSFFLLLLNELFQPKVRKLLF